MKKTQQEILDFIAQCEVQDITMALHYGAKDINGEECFIPQSYPGKCYEYFGFASIGDMREAVEETGGIYTEIDNLISEAKVYHLENLASEEEAGEE